VYFDGKCVSHGLTLADGTKKSVGVILPATLTFNTGAAEIMECVRQLRVQAGRHHEWVKSGAGEKFSCRPTPASRSAWRRALHYICHFG
jgi:uncharacterized protein YaiE (UPF0345 family)